MLNEQKRGLGLEAQIHGSPIYDAYRNFTSLHGNYEVLRLLAAIQVNVERDYAYWSAEEGTYDDGFEDGRERGREDMHEKHFEPIDEAAQALFDAIKERGYDCLKGEVDALEKALSKAAAAL